MKLRGTLALSAAAALVGGLYFLYLVPQAKERELIDAVQARFFRIDAGGVEFLKIRNDRGAFTLTKEGSAWRVTSPRVLAADGTTMERIRDRILTGKILKIITRDAARAAEFGLDRPRAVLAIGYEGRIDELAFGSANPADTGVYASAKGLGAVFLVEKKVMEGLNVGLYDLRAKSLFAFDPGAVTAVRIKSKKGDIELRKEARGWRMARPFQCAAGTEAVQGFLDGVLNQRADDIYDGRIPAAKDYADTITIVLSRRFEREPAIIDAHYWGTAADQGVVAYQKGMTYSGRLPRDFWNLLSRSPDSFCFRSLFTIDENELSSIRVRTEGSEYVLARKGNAWRLGDRAVDSQKAMNFIWFLKSWNAVALLPASTAIPAGSPRLEIVLERSDGTAAGTLKVYGKQKGAAAGFVAEGQVEFYLAVTENLKEPCTVSSLDLQKVPKEEDLVR